MLCFRKMALFVYKFGGTSLGAIGASPREIAARVQNCALHVERAVKNGDQIAVVVSAVGGETDRLVDLWRAVGGGGDGDGAREYDLVVSTGETVSAGLFAAALRARQIPARAMTGAAAGIKTDSSHGKARLSNIDPKPVRAALAAGVVPVITGFQGATADGEVATLGRGGSDTSAVALAAAVKAAECLIFTDVEGVATTDPRVCENARRLDRVTFEEMIEMASLGSKVLQIRAVALAGKTKTPLRVLSSFDADSKPPRQKPRGTLITYEPAMEQPVVSGVAFNRREAQITIADAPDRPGVAGRVFGALAAQNIDIDMIIQNVGGDKKTDISFTVHRDEYDRALAAAVDIAREIGGLATGEAGIAKVSIVGIGMKSHAGVAAKMFETLAAEHINIRMISTSEIKISVIVDEKYLEVAVRSLHDAFDLGRAVEEKDSVAARQRAPAKAKKR